MVQYSCSVKALYLFFPFADQTQRHRLHPAGRKAVTDFLPQEGGKVEADQIIQHRPRLLGVHQLGRYGSGMFDCVYDGVLGDLVEHDALDCDARILLFVQPQGRKQVPGDGLSFPVGVSCQEQAVRFLEGLLDGVDVLLALGQHVILGLEIMRYIHRTLLAGQGAHMAEGGQHLVTLAQELLYGFRLGGRFYNNKIQRHVFSTSL